VLMSLLIDNDYLCRVHNIDIPSNEILNEFVRGLTYALQLKNLTVEQLGEKLYRQINNESSIKFTNCHVFYSTTQQFYKEAWRGFEIHAIKGKITQYCSNCEQANTINECLDRRVLSIMTSVIIEKLLGETKIDLFVLIGSNVAYKGILELCKNYGGRMLIAGFDDIIFDRKDYLTFGNLSNLYSARSTPTSPQPRVADAIPTVIYEGSIGVSVGSDFKEEDLINSLRKYGAAPEKVLFKPHNINTNQRFSILLYKTEKSAINAKFIVHFFKRVDS